jgi:hypothetical protein
VCAAALLLGAPTQARADLELRYSLNGGAFVSIGSAAVTPGIVAQVMGSVDGITITASTSTLLNTGKSSLDLGIQGTLGASITSLVVEASVTGVPTTPPPQTLNWKFTSSSDAGATGESAQGFVDQANNPFGGATGGPAGNIIATTGVLKGPLAQGSTGFSGTVPYSWTEQYSLGATASGTVISTDNNENITASPVVPAPAGLVLAATGLPFLGLGAWFRRRKTLTVA